MTSTPTVGWLGRTFGWSGSREQWLIAAAAAVWLAGLVAIAHYSQYWSVGLTLLATLGWVLLFVLAARHAVVDLFGPVFFYDLMRVSRNRTTFYFRGAYILGIGVFLALSYFESVIDRSSGPNDTARGQLSFFGAVVILFFGIGAYNFTRESWPKWMRMLLIAGVLAFTVYLIAIGIGMLIDGSNQARSVAEAVPSSLLSRFASSFFEKFVVLQFVVMAMITPVTVAPTIAVEKERKTLEFLLATDLRNREIVFGKLASRVLTLIMYVLAGLPLIAFLQLFGGIDPEQLLAVTLGTIVLVIGLSALSIWVSTTLKRSRDAVVMSYMLALGYGFTSFAMAAGSNFGPPGWWNTPFTLFGSTLGVNMIADAFADGNPFWVMLKMDTSKAARLGMGGGVQVALKEFTVFWVIATTLLLTLAILKVRRVALGQAYGNVGRLGRTAIHPKAITGMTPQVNDRDSFNPVLMFIDGSVHRPPMGDNPITWKEVFLDATFKSGWVGRIMAVIVLALVFVWPGVIAWNIFIDPFSTRFISQSFSEKWAEFSEGINIWVRVSTGVMGFLMMMSAALRGAGAIIGEKDRDTWVSLTSTPLSSEDILRGKFWGCVLSLRRAFLIQLLIWGVGLATNSLLPAVIPLLLLLLAVYVSVFALLGLYCSMISRSALVASSRAFGLGLIASGGFWLIVGITCFLPLSLSRSSNYRTERNLSTFLCGFTPPLVYGVVPINGIDREDLGPFDNSNDSVGLFGVFAGTICWGVFGLIMAKVCHRKLMDLMNRSPMRRPQEHPEWTPEGPTHSPDD